MSVAIDRKTAAQFDKDAYDSEFDVGSLVPEYDDEDDLGPAELCIFTCGLSCAITVSI